MEDKTAAIPSLKDFNARQKDRSAQSERTGSMQTKGQLRKSSQSTKKAPPKKSSANQRRSASQDTMRLDTRKVNKSSAGNKSPQSKKSGPAPKTYARERMAQRNSSDYDNSRRIDRAPQSQRAQSRSTQTQRTQPQRPQAQRTQSSRPQNKRPQTQRAVTTPPPKKKKPVTPAMRKARNILVMVSLLLVVLIVGAVLSLTVFFKTENIEVYGIDRYTKKEIVTASGLNMGENIFTAAKKQAGERIERIYPYVEEAEVYSIFPNSIGINLTMAKPACKINAIGGCYIVSDKGKVLEVTSSSADEADVPLIEGVQIKGRAEGEFVDFGSDTLTNALFEMFDAFEALGRDSITAINVITKEDIFELRFVYDDRIVVYMGLPDEITYKIKAADKIIEKLDAEDGKMIAGELDVSQCHDTMRSYFNQYSILAPDVAATAPSTEAFDTEDLL